LCSVNEYLTLQEIIPHLIIFLRDENHDEMRSGACLLLLNILRTSRNTNTVCPHVRKLLPIVMSLMTDSVKKCAETASTIFSQLVLIAPLVKENEIGENLGGEADQVIDHLIHGKKFPPCDIHPTILESLKNAGIVLRNYQLEGISWLRFLQRVKLNGALCDSVCFY
jgi:TATA-binding protein-associated factor